MPWQPSCYLNDVADLEFEAMLAFTSNTLEIHQQSELS